MRVGDAEREAVASQLREHYADGRLTLDELNERVDLAFAARTRADLDSVLRDLPVTSRQPMPAQPNAGYSGSGSQARSGSPLAGLLATVMGLFWLAVAVFGSMFLFGHGNRPIAIVLLLAALAMLRRLLGGGRRGRGRRCGF